MKTSKNLATSTICKNIVKQFMVVVLLKFRSKMKKKWFDGDLLSKYGTFSDGKRLFL